MSEKARFADYAEAVAKRRRMEEAVAEITDWPSDTANKLVEHRVAALLHAQDEEQRLREQLTVSA